jgi:hypothetical protein
MRRFTWVDHNSRINGESLPADSQEREIRNILNSLVTSKKRKIMAVRLEIVISAKNYLVQRLNDEQSESIRAMQCFFNAKCFREMIEYSRHVVAEIFGLQHVSGFCDEVIGHFVAGNLPVPTILDNDAAKLYHMVNIASKGTTFAKLVEIYLVASGHSMGSERVVSYHTAVKTSK